MPLHNLKQLSDEEGIVLWHIVEDEDVLSKMTDYEACPNNITHLRRRREWLAGRVLAKVLANREGLNYEGVGKDLFGKPFLKGYSYHFSLSHSFPYAVAQMRRSCPVGVDIEQPCEKLLNIAFRVFKLGEIENAGGDITKLCVYWCAKEVLYKAYGRDGVLFSEHLKIEPFDLSEAGNLVGSIDHSDHRSACIHLRYVICAHFVLVYLGVN